MDDLGLPLHQTIGNHDAVNGGWKLFEKYFGPRYYTFDYEGDRFIVLDNSLNGSFDSVQFAWLKEQYGVEVVTLTVDLGGGSRKDGIERRAMSAGASRAYVVDARETFVKGTAPRIRQKARLQKSR